MSATGSQLNYNPRRPTRDSVSFLVQASLGERSPTCGRLVLGGFFGALAAAFHFVAEGLNLLAEDAIEEVVLQFGSTGCCRIAVRFRWGIVEVLVGPTLNGDDDEERSDEGFLQVSKAKVFGDVCDGFAEFWRVIDCRVGG